MPMGRLACITHFTHVFMDLRAHKYACTKTLGHLEAHAYMHVGMPVSKNMQTCMLVQKQLYMNVCMHVHLCNCKHAYAHVCRCTHVNERVYMYARVCMHVYAHVCTCMHVFARVYISLQVYARVYTCIRSDVLCHICMCMIVCICICT